MLNTDIFDLLYLQLEEGRVNRVLENLKVNVNYQKALQEEAAIYQHYEGLNLSKEQDKIVEAWGEAITARNAAYSAVIFRMGMQCCFSLLMQLSDLK